MGFLMGCLLLNGLRKLSTFANHATIIPLRLTGGAYVVYQQFGDNSNLDEIKRTLYKAFGMHVFVAWQQFGGWWLCPGEMVNGYLAELCKICVIRLLQVSSMIDELPTDQLLAWAWNILRETEYVAATSMWYCNMMETLMILPSWQQVWRPNML